MLKISNVQNEVSILTILTILWEMELNAESMWAAKMRTGTGRPWSSHLSWPWGSSVERFWEITPKRFLDR